MEKNQSPLCGLKREDFQKEINGRKTDLFILTNSDGMEVAITNYGGALVAIMVPDRDGQCHPRARQHRRLHSFARTVSEYSCRQVWQPHL